MDQILFWRIFLLGGILTFLGVTVATDLAIAVIVGVMGIFTLKLLAASTGRKRILDFFIR